MKRTLRSFVAALLLLTLLPSVAGATWSLVVLNIRTGEVCVASATCLSNFDLLQRVPVIVVGMGGAAAQSSIDTGAFNRRIIYDDLILGFTPQQILDDLAMNGSAHQSRQYGIVSFTGPAVTFSGTGAGQAKAGVVGQVGDFVYAVQGNLLTDASVVHAAAGALINTPGDLGQKVMAGMQAARALGGDGRCSCSPGAPTSCGAPPPMFTKSAHVGFVIVARLGDPDPGCQPGMGCASGDYYLSLNVTNSGSSDPVELLQGLYDTWRAALSGHPDHVLSTVTSGAAKLPADGITQTSVTVQLVDVDGVPLTSGGATVTVATADGRVPFATPGPVVDNGDGSYTFTLTAGTLVGSDTFVVVADDGAVQAQLFPPLEIEVEPAQPLFVGFDELSTADGGAVPFVISVPSAAGGFYVLLASGSGTSPGVPVGALVLPLNPDPIFCCSVNEAGTSLLPGSVGTLDGQGRAEAAFVAAPGMLASMVGMRLDWATLTLGSVGLGVTNP